MAPSPARSPLYEAHHAPRYERQRLIREYEASYRCRLVVLSDTLFQHSVTLFEEVLYDADPAQDLHVMLSTPGGDGETAIRLIRQAQSRCRELTVIVPDQAKSAGTLFVLGAHHGIAHLPAGTELNDGFGARCSGAREPTTLHHSSGPMG